jgi:protein LTV1
VELDDDSSEQACASEDRIGQASLYGIFYDDTEYDYMQHLREVGVQEEGVESILIEAPGPKRLKRKNSTEFLSTEIPREALPSASELPRTYESQEAIPSSIAGLQPDMDPHLRQVLQALEDDAFVDEGLEEDFFGELLADGTRRDGEEFLYEFNEDGEKAGAKESVTTDDERDESWEARFARFKIEQKQIKAVVGSDTDGLSEGGDTVGRLPALSVIGGKRRRKGTSDASGYSMSSSSMFRNDALQTLDARFDQAYLLTISRGSFLINAAQVMEKEYDSDQNDGNDREDSEHSDGSAAPELITSRDDFGALMDDFLDNYEMLGRKMKPKLEGETGVEKLNTIRRALGPAHLVSPGIQDSDETEEESLAEEDREKDRWDCETILSELGLTSHAQSLADTDSTRSDLLKS